MVDNEIFLKSYRREILKEPTEWKKIGKYQLFFGDIRNNTTKKFYILARGGIVFGAWYSFAESYLYPHPNRPGFGTVRFFAQSLARNVPVATLATLSFGGFWYAWNTYFDSDNAYGPMFAANAAWVLCAGPVLKKWRRLYSFFPWAFVLGIFHISPLPAHLPIGRTTQYKISNPRHYEFDLLGNKMKPLTGISYELDEEDY